MVDVFRARIVDVTNDSLIIEITGDEEKIDGFVEVLRPYGIIEMVRTGVGIDDARHGQPQRIHVRRSTAMAKLIKMFN